LTAQREKLERAKTMKDQLEAMREKTSQLQEKKKQMEQQKLEKQQKMKEIKEEIVSIKEEDEQPEFTESTVIANDNLDNQTNVNEEIKDKVVVQQENIQVEKDIDEDTVENEVENYTEKEVENESVEHEEEKVLENEVDEETVVESEPTKDFVNADENFKDESKENTSEDTPALEEDVEEDNIEEGDIEEGHDASDEGQQKISEIVKKIEGKCATVKGDLADMAMSEQYLRTKQAMLLAKKKEKEMDVALNIASIREAEVTKMRQKVQHMQELLAQRKEKLKIQTEMMKEKSKEKEKMDKIIETRRRRGDYVEKEIMERLVFDKEPPKKK